MKKLKKLCGAVLIAGFMLPQIALGSTDTAEAASGKWKRDGKKWWYSYSDGTYPKSKWEKIGGRWYHFDKSGYMQTGWQKISGKWYYFGTNGIMKTGWQKIGGKWYYFANGAMKTGWLKSGGKWYYFDGSGAMVTGKKSISGKTYTFGNDGAMKEGSSGSSSGIQVGEIITFGHYEQDNNKSNGKEEIEWRVLDKKDDKLLLISLYVLDNKPFHNVDIQGITWDKCSLRGWLNGTFYNEAFNASEKSKIMTTTVKAESSINDLLLANGRKSSVVPVGSDTKDKIFLLSIKEARKYFVGEIISKAHWANYVPQTYCLDRACQPTKYAVNQGAEIGFADYHKGYTHGGSDKLGYTIIDSHYERNEETNNKETDSSCWWLLRERGWDDSEDTHEVAAVSIYGNVYPGHYPDIDKGVGVRPVMWIQQ